MFIRVKNTLADNAPKTNSSAAIQAGATNLPVKNTNDFQQNYYAQIGKTGDERSEIILVQGLGTNALTVGTTRFPQPADTPVFNIKYNQVIVKRSTSGTTGTATALGTVNITPDQPFTQYEDVNAAAGYAYKTAWYNSTLDVYSSDSNWITYSGYSAYSRYGIRNAIRSRIKNIPGIEDGDLNLWINEYMELMRNAAVQVNEDYGLGTLNVAVTAGTQEYQITDTLYRTPARVWMMDGSGTVPYLPIYMSEIDPIANYSWSPRFYLTGDNGIGFLPVPVNNGTAQIIQNQLDERLDNDDEEIPRPMRPYVTGFIKYGQAQAYRQDGKDVLADNREEFAMAQIDLFKREINPRQRVMNEQVTTVMGTNFINDFSDWGF